MEVTTSTTAKKRNSKYHRSSSPPPLAPENCVQNGLMVASPTTKQKERLAPLEFSKLLGPLGRFLKHDRPIGGIGPPRRVLLFIMLGFLFSLTVLILTEDEYYQGPKDTGVNKNDDDNQRLVSDFYPVHISFRGLGCEVQPNGWVLQNISGDARPGRLTAVLGASGSGKTTLAHALLGRSRKVCHTAAGTVYLNGEAGSLDSFLDRVGFVPQDDVLYAELTVLETLRFSARSRLSRHLAPETIEQIVMETARNLDIEHVLDYYVGGPKKRGLSGGERKRVSIGVELVARPSVLVLDEPTSGLDGATAHKLVENMKCIARKYNVSVISVIHQPSSRSFALFDDLILLQKGRLVYVGPREEAIDYFKVLQWSAPNFTVLETVEVNPAEILLDITTGFKTLNSDFLHSDFFKLQMGKVAAREEAFRDASVYKRGKGVVDMCDHIRSEKLRFACIIRKGLMYALGLAEEEGESYQKRPKAGIVFQSYQWWVLLWALTLRRGIRTEMFSVVILACTCGFVRHFNRSWQRRTIALFYCSVSMGLLGMMGAALEDDILPVRRAVASGMLLGAHEFALLIHSLNKGFAISHIFVLVYFGIQYVLDAPPSAVAAGYQRQFVCTPFSFLTYLKFHHLIQINYYASRGFGLLINVWVDHDPAMSIVLCAGLLMGAHSFSLYTPSYTQLANDRVKIFGVDISKPFLFLCSFSYVRYFLQATLLWDPDPTDQVGRNYTLKLYSYQDGTEAACATTMTLLIVASQVVRFVIFAVRNANDFASFHDAPLFLIFLTKIILIYGFALIFAIVYHEMNNIKKAWDSAWTHSIQRRDSISLEERESKAKANL